MKHYFTSDYHFGHTNILKYDNRPYTDIVTHDNDIIAKHNSIVTDEDEVYFLGDFTFSKDKKYVESLLVRLNGKKFFIKGNHDRSDMIKLYHKYGTYLGELAEIFVGEQKIVLCHYAMKVWNKSHCGAWHLYGHSHGSLFNDPSSLSFDVGIMLNNYYPLSFEQISVIMSKKQFKSIDHHD